MALFQQHVDISPGFVDIVFAIDQAVVNDHQINHQNQYNTKKNKSEHGSSRDRQYGFAVGIFLELGPEVLGQTLRRFKEIINKSATNSAF